MNSPFYNEPLPQCLEAARVVLSRVKEHQEWAEEIDKGKMFGVLLTEQGEVLYAYSGQLLGRYDWEGFVPPVFNYLGEDGYFKQEEARIVSLNQQIKAKESSTELREARNTLYNIEREVGDSLASYKTFMAESKAKRESLRRYGDADEAALVRESQHQKAELRRLKAACNERLAHARMALQAIQDGISQLKTERKRRSDALQYWLFEHFVMPNGRGEEKNLMEIFSEWAAKTGSKCVVPPSGSGECCAPKLLQYAFRNGLKPLAIGEFTLMNGDIQWREACQSRCAAILDWMLQGIDVDENPLQKQEERTTLDVLYEDEYLLVVNKPAGMLSVPGKSSRLSALDILRTMRPECPSLMLCHRLDMQTSGVLVAAKDLNIYKVMQAMFLTHDKIRKTYIALLDGNLSLPVGTKGEISLPLSADYLNRPRQKVDKINGKEAITRYEIIGEKDGYTLVRLHPVTGRTHQLRVHCAHPEGLNMPILGDDLYGKHASRLYLHAQSIKFEHPATAKKIVITSQCEAITK